MVEKTDPGDGNKSLFSGMRKPKFQIELHSVLYTLYQRTSRNCEIMIYSFLVNVLFRSDVLFFSNFI